MSEKAWIAPEENGIKAIKYLQGLAGIKETTKSARAGWNKMSADAQRQTMQAYATISGDTTVMYKRNIVLAKPEKPRAKSHHQHSRLVSPPSRKSR